MKSMNYEKELRLGTSFEKECRLPSLVSIDLEGFLNVGEHGTLKMALDIIDCQLAIIGEKPSACFLQKDKLIITCNGSKSGLSSHDVAGVLLEIFEAYYSESLNFYRDQTILLSSVLADLTKRAILRYLTSGEDLKRILQQPTKLNGVLQDNLLVGKELLRFTASLPDLKSKMRKLSIEFQDISEKFRDERQDNTGGFLDLDTIPLLKLEPLVEVLEKQTNFDREQPRERLYCIFCRCLLVYLTSKALGAVISVAILYVTILTAMQASVSGLEAGHAALEIVFSQLLLMTMFLFGGDTKKREPSRNASTQSSRNTAQGPTSQLL